MRIALIALHFAEYSYCLANAMAQDNDVLLIAEKHAFKGELGSLLPDGANPRLKIHFVEHKRSISAIFSNSASIRSVVKVFNPDVVHVQEVIWDYLILALPFLKRYPLLLTIHDPEMHSGETKLAGLKKRYHLYRKFLRRSCDAAIAHGSYLQGEVERLLPHLQGKVFSIPHGPLGKLAKNPNFDWEPGTLLFFGRIQAYKGLAFFIEAVERLAAEGLRVKGLIAGRGDELNKYRERLANSGLFEINEGFIPREDIPALFERANAIVLPYTDGTQSGVAALAMGYARPVVASRVGSIPELVRENETGYLTEAKSVSDLVEKLRDLLRNPPKAMQMGQNGWELCQTELSWRTIGDSTVNSYKKVVAKHTSPNR